MNLLINSANAIYLYMTKLYQSLQGHQSYIGPSVLYIISKSIEHGKKAGMTSVLGIGVGNIFHVVAAAFGLSINSVAFLLGNQNNRISLLALLKTYIIY